METEDWLSSRGRRGLAYGGMPMEALLEKMEETDLPLVSNGFAGSYHKDYMIEELVDRTLDKPFLDSDVDPRNPQTSREVMNVRFGGTRGTENDVRHPDLFLGFLGDDPRGSENLPRFDHMRAQLEHRVRLLEPRMTDSVGHDGGDGEASHMVASRPWTGPELQDMRVRLHEESRARLKIFAPSLEGADPVAREAGALDALAGRSASRRASRAGASAPLGRGREGLAVGSDPRDPARGAALRRAAVADAPMPVAYYGRAASGVVGALQAEAAAGAVRAASLAGGVMGGSRAGRAVGGSRALVAALMGAEAQAARAAAARAPGGADGMRGAPEREAAPRTMTPAGDVARAYYASDAGRLPAALAEKTGRARAPAAELVGAAAMAVAAAWHGHTDQPGAALGGVVGANRGAAPAADAARARRLAEAALQTSGAAGREVASYRSVATASWRLAEGYAAGGTAARAAAGSQLAAAAAAGLATRAPRPGGRPEYGGHTRDEAVVDAELGFAAGARDEGFHAGRASRAAPLAFLARPYGAAGAPRGGRADRFDSRDVAMEAF